MKDIVGQGSRRVLKLSLTTKRTGMLGIKNSRRVLGVKMRERGI